MYSVKSNYVLASFSCVYSRYSNEYLESKTRCFCSVLFGLHAVRTDTSQRCVHICYTEFTHYHSVVYLTTGPQPLPKRVLCRVWSSVSSLIFQYLLAFFSHPVAVYVFFLVFSSLIFPSVNIESTDWNLFTPQIKMCWYSLNSLSRSTILLATVCQILSKSDKNVYNVEKITFTPLNKVWLSLHLFSWNLQLFSCRKWRSSPPI